MSDYVVRMEKESEELQQRISDLSGFMRTEVFYTLEEAAQWEMQDQLNAMQHYSTILNKRIARGKGWLKKQAEPVLTCGCNHSKGTN
ncbi:hypothetical protein VPHD292_0031 [Vibrio phage D292]